MVGDKRAQTKTKPRTFKYFFLDGQLHQRLQVNRGADELVAWSYPLHQRVTYSYTSVLKNQERAFTTAQVCAMIHRVRLQVEKAILNGDIPEPQYTYGLNERKRKFQYMWREADIMELHRYFSGVHKGRPRKDGKITPMWLPTPRELRAMIRQEEILYVKSGDEFIPTWAAPDL